VNLLLWIVILVAGAVLGATFASALAGVTLSALGGAAFFPLAALLLRLAFWMLTRTR
jgi:glucose dehydrogenase